MIIETTFFELYDVCVVMFASDVIVRVHSQYLEQVQKIVVAKQRRR